MIYKKDLGFAEMIRGIPITEDLVEIFKESFEINSKVFYKNPEKFKIYVCDSENEYEEYAKPYYSKKSTAVGLGMKGIATRSPEFIERLGRWKKKDFPKLMNHEVSHIFWYQLCKTWSPQWFVEGLACYVGKNYCYSKNELRSVIERFEVDFKILDFRYQRRKFRDGYVPRYPIWQAFFEFLVERFSLKRIEYFIKEYSENANKKNYEMIFRKIFGKTDRVLFNEFLKSV